MATKSKMDNTVSKTIETISQKTKMVNEGAVRGSHQLLDGMFERAGKWQDLFAQALETSVAYYGVQQDRLLTKIEGFKAQYDKGENPFADLLSFKSTDLPAAPAEVLDKTVTKAKKATKRTTTKAKAVKKTATKKVTTAKKAVNKKVATTKKTATKAATTVAKKATTTKKTATNAVTTVAKKAVAKAKVTPTKVAAPKAVKSVTKNDLKDVKGIGPKMEVMLNAAGITTFADLAAATPKQLAAVLMAAGPRYKSFDTTDWTKQAKQLMK